MSRFYRNFIKFFLFLLPLYPQVSYGVEITVKRTVAMMPQQTTDAHYRRFHGAVGDIDAVNEEVTSAVYMKSDNAQSIENTIDNPIPHKIYKMIERHKALYISGVEDVPILNKHKVYTKDAMVRSDYAIELKSFANNAATLRLYIDDEVMSGSNRSGFMNIKGSNNTLLQSPVIAKAAEQVNIEKLHRGKEFVFYVLPKIEKEASGIQRMVFYQISVR